MGLLVAQLFSSLASASTLFLVAAGLSLIFGVTRIVNFAHGSFFMIGAYVGLLLASFATTGFLYWAAVLGAALVAGLCGLLLELLVLRRVYRAPEMVQLVACFGFALIVQDGIILLFGAEDQIGPRAPGFTGRFELLGQSIPHYDLLLIMLAPLVLLLLHMLMKHTRFGLWTRAATDDRDMLAALGVNQSLLFSAVFFLGALLAGLGGALQLPKAGAHAGMDLEILAAAFVVVVCGGMGSISGAYIAALLISLAEVFAIRFLPESALFTMFLVLALILWLRPHGLFGQPEAQASFAPSDLAEKPAFQPLSRQIKIALPGALILLCAMPLLLSASHLPLLTDLLIMSLFAASLFLVVGVSGLMSFGHAAFFGIGAYATALLVTKSTIAMPYAILIAPVAGGLIAGLAGFLFLRLKGVYFAMLTLAFAQVLWSLAQQWIDVTGGENGILGLWAPAFMGRNGTYYLVLVAVALALAGLYILIFSPFGFAVRAVRDSALRARALGLDPRRLHTRILAIAGAAAGLAGGLHALAKGSVFPDVLEAARSFEGLIMIYLGGIASLFGPLLGSSVLTLMEDMLGRYDIWRLTLGLSILMIVLLAPQGIAGTTHTLKKMISSRRRS